MCPSFAEPVLPATLDPSPQRMPAGGALERGARPSGRVVRAARAASRTIGRARRSLGHLASDVGQGTVEYVGLLLLMSTILAAIVGAASSLGGEHEIGQRVVKQIGHSIDRAGQGADR